jgi:F0F1-type ATP synthase assembly protein I
LFTAEIGRQGFPVADRPEPPETQANGERSGKPAAKSGWNETAVLLARLSGIGWYVAGSIAAGVVLGWFLDRQFDTRPVLTLIGLALGVLVAFTGMFRLLSALGRKKQ